MDTQDTKLYKLGRKIFAARRSKKLSQDKFVDIIDISRDHLAKIETGKRAPSLELLFKISEALEVPLKEFFDFENNIAP